MHHVAATTGRRVRIRIKQDALYDQPERIIEAEFTAMGCTGHSTDGLVLMPEAMRKELKKTSPNLILEDD